MEDRSIAICADDFGLHEGVNQACLALAHKGRLSAVSCLTGGPSWPGQQAIVAQLAALPVDLGLHLDFTECPLDATLRHPLNALMVLAFARRLDRTRVANEIHAQLDAFEAVAGRGPDHVDGHQHVHQFPVIRQELVRALAQRYPGRKPWLRRTAALGAAGTPRFKPAVIAQLGCGALSRLAQQDGFTQNRRLAGVYGFDAGAQDYLALLARWLGASGSGDLLLCHPGQGLPGNDAMAAARAVEFSVLGGERFGGWLAQHRLRIGRLVAGGQESFSL